MAQIPLGRSDVLASGRSLQLTRHPTAVPIPLLKAHHVKNILLYISSQKQWFHNCAVCKEFKVLDEDALP